MSEGSVSPLLGLADVVVACILFLRLTFWSNLLVQNDLWNNKHFKVIDDHFADDITSKSDYFIFLVNFFHSYCLDHWPGQITSGKDEIKTKFLLPLFNAFPDLKWVCLEGT